MWIERIALISFFGLLTLLCVCLNLDDPPAERKNWFHVFAPLWTLFLILFILLIVNWGDFLCVACRSPGQESADPDIRTLAEQRRKRRPSDAADLLLSTVAIGLSLAFAILLAIYLNGDSTVLLALVIILLITQLVVLVYLALVSCYNTVRRRLKRNRLSYASCISTIVCCCCHRQQPLLTDEPVEDLSVCGDSGVGRCKCAAGWGPNEMTWIDSVQGFLLTTLLLAFLLSTVLFLIAVCEAAATTTSLTAGVILAPIYGVLGALILNGCCIIWQIARRGGAGYAWTTCAIYFLSLLLALKFVILLALRLDTGWPTSWFFVYMPLLVATFVASVGACTIMCCPMCRRTDDAPTWGVLVNEPPPLKTPGFENEFDEVAI